MQAEQQREREALQELVNAYDDHRDALGAWGSGRPAIKTEIRLRDALLFARAALSHPSTPQGWPCEVVEADFSEDTITLQMKDDGYLVSAGEYRLIPPPPEQGSSNV